MAELKRQAPEMLDCIARVLEKLKRIFFVCHVRDEIFHN
jgi:hypothetical protein